MKRELLVAVGVAIAVAGSGCGSGTLSRTELVQKANAICKKREASIAASVARVRDVRAFRAAERQLLPTMVDAVARLKALNPPESARRQYERFVADDRALVAGIRRRLAGSQGYPKENLRGHQRYGLIRQLGLTDCRS